jgi:catechol 2,3-dioxygenase-like lactoylglutathione lyase family enzyme
MVSVRRVIISTTNAEASRGFYAEVLGLPTAYSQGPITALSCADGTEILLHERPAVPSDAALSVGLVVEGLDALIETWRARGGAVVDEPRLQPWGEYQAVVRDPDGHLVCLVSDSP